MLNGTGLRIPPPLHRNSVLCYTLNSSTFLRHRPNPILSHSTRELARRISVSHRIGTMGTFAHFKVECPEKCCEITIVEKKEGWWEWKYCRSALEGDRTEDGSSEG